MNIFYHKPFTYCLVLLILMLSLCANEAKAIENRGVMDNFNNGLKFAGQMFGINTAADVANLVAKAFSKAATRRKPDFMSLIQQSMQAQSSSAEENDQEAQENAQESPPIESDEQQSTPEPAKARPEFSSSQMFANMLRMIGFDANKLGALAINALVMIAQAIGNTLMLATRHSGFSNAATGPEELHTPNDHEPRKLRSGTPIDWFLQNPTPQMQKLLQDLTDKQLPERIVQMIEDLETEQHQGSCLKLLMCKSSPFIWGMQRSLEKRLNNKTDVAEDTQEEVAAEDAYFNKKIFFQHMPSLVEFRKHSETCEARFAKFCDRKTHNKSD